MLHKVDLGMRGACIAAGLTLFFSVETVGREQPALFVEVNGGSATVIANNVPVRDILEEIAMQTGIIVYSRSTLATNATYSIHDEPVSDVIRRILQQRNFTLHYVTDATTGRPVFGSRLWILADDTIEATPVWNAGQPAPEWTLKYAAGDPENIRLQTVANAASDEEPAGADSALIAAMNDPSVKVREEAIYGLGELGGPAAIDLLRRSLYDPDTRIRVAAIAALTETANNDAIVALSGLLGDESAWIRSVAIDALAAIGGDVANQFLQQALADSNETNRETAADYLAEPANRELENRF